MKFRLSLEQLATIGGALLVVAFVSTYFKELEAVLKIKPVKEKEEEK